MTRSEENYLKAIFHLGNGEAGSISTNAIAEQMETKPSSVTDMAKKLAEKGLVHYKKYQGISLTDDGTRTALSIIRKHRLWEVFLVKKLDFTWDEVHEVAEQLEHIKSEKLIDKIDALLDFPKYDPHGDPIPTKDGKFMERDKQLLSEMPIHAQGVCVGVKDSSAPFLKFLDKNKIALGNTIKILDKEDFDQSLQIQMEGRELRISHQIASNLYVKKND
ncbi:metal-dependent transcriptional regulator [Flagellimonas taeanensis]|jgi:DtxR family Mn-dependent transcriptional regulator|uniref:Transcriptional regulator MntR n=1 Tax=Flagellimonas taeanensis TaxID=1005926 RepID=A0A1M6Y089_9FLAO|nr:MULTISPECIES: metal-dependent transcriptional regulator [Allomuricauda]MDC6383792.1 metal-dependent transcriptional regulator [Muricauda sp. SK9]MEE1961805.1 metal-dependent transcriptional regulator [Allomuricauda taeanensis]RIV48419.1 metal-dependent transcriptional regulator [Allomuricauda taeanensis]SFC04432.1 iron (metal) dependent repressor, DtxR family [Allomuricauda taeanensis]SHL11523.1 iron (metal) dependent repressor, DtxR family [Allomuricauda taeanensis]